MLAEDESKLVVVPRPKRHERVSVTLQLQSDLYDEVEEIARCAGVSLHHALIQMIAFAVKAAK